MLCKETNKRADELRSQSKEELILALLGYEQSLMEISEVAFGDMYEGREPFTKADVIERLEEFEEKAFYYDKCVEIAAKDTDASVSGKRKAAQAANTCLHMYVAMLTRSDRWAEQWKEAVLETLDATDEHLPIG
jgi:hypothetical protein|tara:strand:- start:22082 stop:22483 length:402 start_codon:yes stop_codon:yes gene_type:complete